MLRTKTGYMRGTGRRRHLRLQVETLEARALLTTGMLDPATQPKFVNELPNPLAPGYIFQPTEPGGEHYEIGVYEIAEQDLGLVDPHSGEPLLTTVWGYGTETQPATYPGRTIVARRDEQITVHWTNELMDDAGEPLHHILPVDTTLHWANPDDWPHSGVPVVTHLHGGHSESASDGLPEAWFTPGFEYVGEDWVKETYTYDNDQEATSLWYHDHALGLTRLNVYAGLAGFYILRDDYDTGEEDNPLGLPAGDYEVPILIQDRMFTEHGELFFAPHEEHEPGEVPEHQPEFFGDFILVNGKAWPSLEVEPRKYRFRFLNGSDSRFYNLFLSSGQTLYQIGTDGGLLDAPVPLAKLTLSPAERADVVVDFSDPALWGQTIILRNNAKAPFPKGTPADPHTVGQIMAFKVVKPLSGPDMSTLPTTLRQEPISFGGAANTQQLLLFERMDEHGRHQALLGTVAEGAMLWSDPPTETPTVNTVEVWEFFNTTEDTHPIHIHLPQFQVLDRQKFRADQNPETGALTNIRRIGRPKPPAANEDGLKDTVQMNPGEVTRIIATFDREGQYVWHCHILSHEDHEMMRPYVVMADTAAPGAGQVIASLLPVLPHAGAGSSADMAITRVAASVSAGRQAQGRTAAPVLRNEESSRTAPLASLRRGRAGNASRGAGHIHPGAVDLFLQE